MHQDFGELSGAHTQITDLMKLQHGHALWSASAKNLVKQTSIAQLKSAGITHEQQLHGVTLTTTQYLLDFGSDACMHCCFENGNGMGLLDSKQLS